VRNGKLRSFRPRKSEDEKVRHNMRRSCAQSGMQKLHRRRRVTDLESASKAARISALAGGVDSKPSLYAKISTNHSMFSNIGFSYVCGSYGRARRKPEEEEEEKQIRGRWGEAASDSCFKPVRRLHASKSILADYSYVCLSFFPNSFRNSLNNETSGRGGWEGRTHAARRGERKACVCTGGRAEGMC